MPMKSRKHITILLTKISCHSGEDKAESTYEQKLNFGFYVDFNFSEDELPKPFEWKAEIKGVRNYSDATSIFGCSCSELGRRLGCAIAFNSKIRSMSKPLGTTWNSEYNKALLHSVAEEYEAMFKSEHRSTLEKQVHTASSGSIQVNSHNAKLNLMRQQLLQKIVTWLIFFLSHGAKGCKIQNGYIC